MMWMMVMMNTKNMRRFSQLVSVTCYLLSNNVNVARQSLHLTISYINTSGLASPTNGLAKLSKDQTRRRLPQPHLNGLAKLPKDQTRRRLPLPHQPRLPWGRLPQPHQVLMNKATSTATSTPTVRHATRSSILALRQRVTRRATATVAISMLRRWPLSAALLTNYVRCVATAVVLCY